MSRRVLISLFFSLASLLFVLNAGCSDDDPATPDLPATQGTININQTPENLVGAAWMLTGPQNKTGSGFVTLPDMAVGEYELTWDSVEGYLRPISDPQTLVTDGVMTFNGAYSNDPGPVQGFVQIPPASIAMPITFTMGSTFNSSETPHQVTLTGRFNMASTEVTNAQYVAVLQWAYSQGHVTVTSSSVRDAFDGSNAELLDLDSSSCQISFSGNVFSTTNPDRPVVEVSWYGSVAYCDWLSLREGLPRAYDHSNWSCNSGNSYTATGYRLPTEAEWEFACRAGTVTRFNTGDCLDAGTQANYHGSQPHIGCASGPYIGRTVDVGSYLSNQWGLFDLHGNVYQWCNDWYGGYNGDEIDPEGAGAATGRVLRGGNWNNSADYCRSSFRYAYPPNISNVTVGFRPVKSTN